MKTAKPPVILTLASDINKSNSEMIPESMTKNESFKDFPSYQNSVNIGASNQIIGNQREEFKSQNYKKALDKFQEFKKEQQMLRK